MNLAQRLRRDIAGGKIAMSYVIAGPRELLTLVGSRQVEAVVIACMTAITNRTAVT